MEDAEQMVKDLSELRITHCMNLEDENWALDERLEGSKPDKLKGFAKFFEIQPMELSTALSRRNSFIGESSFKDFRDYCKGTIEDFQVSTILHNLDKQSHFGSIEKVIARNVAYTVDGKRNIRQ